jgi:hypothetical protein
MTRWERSEDLGGYGFSDKLKWTHQAARLKQIPTGIKLSQVSIT